MHIALISHSLLTGKQLLENSLKLLFDIFLIIGNPFLKMAKQTLICYVFMWMILSG